MTAYKKHKNRLEKFLQSEHGKRFLNFTYSFGAAIVILGAMFKILHLPYGNLMLAVGMITEILVFTISAFDTPAKDYSREEVFPVPATGKPEDRPGFSATRAAIDNAPVHTVSAQHFAEPAEDIPLVFSAQTSEYNKQMETLNRNISGLNAIYEIQLKNIGAQIDSIEQITQGLNRVKTMYDNSIPDGYVIRNETDKMAGLLRELNSVYARMLEAMTNPQTVTRNT